MISFNICNKRRKADVCSKKKSPPIESLDVIAYWSQAYLKKHFVALLDYGGKNELHWFSNRRTALLFHMLLKIFMWIRKYELTNQQGISKQRGCKLALALASPTLCKDPQQSKMCSLQKSFSWRLLKRWLNMKYNTFKCVAGRKLKGKTVKTNNNKNGWKYFMGL